jgi:hypothetical protein
MYIEDLRVRAHDVGKGIIVMIFIISHCYN